MQLAQSFIERNGTMLQLAATFVVAIIGGILGFYLRQREKKSKVLDYRVIDDVPIFPTNRRPSALSVTYLGEEVHDPRIARILIENTGTEVIDVTDYLEPLSIEHGSVKLLDRLVIVNPNLVSKLESTSSDESAVTIYPKTLNAGDWFVIQLVYDGDLKTRISLTGRIRGQTRGPKVISLPGESRFGKALNDFITLSPLLAAATAMTSWVVAAFTDTAPDTFALWVIAALLGVYSGARIFAPWLIKSQLWP